MMKKRKQAKPSQNKRVSIIMLLNFGPTLQVWEME